MIPALCIALADFVKHTTPGTAALAADVRAQAAQFRTPRQPRAPRFDRVGYEQRLDRLLRTIADVESEVTAMAEQRGIDPCELVARCIVSFWDHYHRPAVPTHRRKRVAYARWGALQTAHSFCRRRDRAA